MDIVSAVFLAGAVVRARGHAMIGKTKANGSVARESARRVMAAQERRRT